MHLPHALDNEKGSGETPEPSIRTIFTGNPPQNRQSPANMPISLHYVAALGARDDSRAHPFEISGQNSAINPSVMIDPTKPLEKNTPRLP